MKMELLILFCAIVAGIMAGRMSTRWPFTKYIEYSFTVDDPIVRDAVLGTVVTLPRGRYIVTCDKIKDAP